MAEQLQAEGQDLQLFRDECLGSGAYGKVCKAKLNELPCAAKLLHAILFESDDPQSPTIHHRFVQECQLLQMVRHPNVVQYLGVTHDLHSGLPILLMELLDGNLTDFLEHSDGPIPYHVQVNLWHDIAIALTYLHSKHIIHRDLSGNNVLLIAGSRAKVTDFGMSMLTDVDITKRRLTHCPGNAAFMSPEALIEPPTYGEKLDVFSSGVVAIQIITRKFPKPAPNVTRHKDPSTSSGFSVALVPEIERRKDHINSIDPKHPMLPIALGCLNDNEQNRPSARQLCCQLVSLKEAPEYTESMQQKSPQVTVREQEQQILELQKQIDNERQQNQQQHHVVVQLQNDITIKERAVQELEQQIQELQKQIDSERQEQHHLITVKERELQELEQAITEQKLQNRKQEQVVQQLVHEQQQAIHDKQQQLEKQQQEIREQQSSIQQMQTQITRSEKDMQVLNTQLHENSQELQLKKQELWRAQYNLQQKTEEFKQKTEELQQKTEEFQHKREELQGQLQQALQDQGLQEFQTRIMELETKLKENQDQRRLMEQLPPVFVERFTAEELPQHLKKLIEEGFQEWEENLCKFRLFCGHPSNGDLMEGKLEVHKNVTLAKATERAYQALELEKCGVQLEQCQLVRYNNKFGTLGKPFDEPKEIPLGEVVGGFQSYLSFDLFMEIRTDPATLPQHEQRMRAARAIRINYSLLWQHLDASKVLPKLVHKCVISEAKKNEVESYRQSCGQNAVIIDALFFVECAPEGLLAICDILQTTPGKEHIAQHILQDYRRQPLPVRVLQSLATENAPLFSEVSLQFQNLERAVVDMLVQCPNALTQLKQCLASLVLPLGDGKVASLVDPGSYQAVSTIPEFFKLMAPYWNCLSTNLLSLLLEASGCKHAPARLAEFEEARASSGHLVICTQRASTDRLSSVHSLPLEQLQCLHPAVFTESRAAVHAERNTARITSEVDKLMLHVSCLEEITTTICGFFRLPKAALVYAGCSENPLALCWLVSRDLLSYMTSHKGGTSGDRLLAEQQITQIAFGDTESCRCLNLKEVKLHEASRYGLLERIPILLSSVSVDAASAGGWTSLYYACQEGHYQVADLLLQAGASVEQETEDGQTALYIACEKGHDQIVELLLRRKANVNHQTKDGETPLWIASFDGHQRVVELLLAAGANPDIQKDGFAALHVACFGGHYQVAELLLQAGTSVELEAKTGQTALYIASRDGHDQIVELLLRREVNVNHQTKTGRTPLWTASFNGHQTVVEILLAAGANPDIQKEDGWTPLHVACQEGHYQVAELLLQAGTSVELEAKTGQTALYIASRKGHDQIVELLLRREVNVNHQTKIGESPLWAASFNGHQRVVELLLAAGANPDILKEDGWTPLHVACQEGHYQVAELLLQAGASVEQETEVQTGQTALYIASRKGHDQTVELLLRREADVNHQTKIGESPLWAASFNGHQRVVELLLAAGANPDILKEGGCTLLHYSCQEGHYQVAELLLQAGASVELETKVRMARQHCKKGHDQIVELLLRREADVNHQTKTSESPMWTASFNGHQRVVELLLEAGANRDIHKEDGWTPFHAACQEGQYQVAELLLQAGTSVEQKTKDGQTALYIASRDGHDQIVELLLRREVNVNIQTKVGRTPLWIASFNGHQRVVELLLAAGANPDIQKDDGWTPLHVACQEGHCQVAELLLQAGASVELEAKTGQTPLSIASWNGHDQIVELLLRREVNVNHQTKDGLTALVIACFKGRDQIVEFLLRREADVNHHTKFDQTPLTIARSQGHDRIVQLLCEASTQRTVTKSPANPVPKTPTAQSPPSPMSRLFKFWKS